MASPDEHKTRTETATLNALGRMAAETSTRWQGEVFIALARSRISLAPGEAIDALLSLEAAGMVADIIHLDDGGIVVTLTPEALLRIDAGQDPP